MQGFENQHSKATKDWVSEKNLCWRFYVHPFAVFELLLFVGLHTYTRRISFTVAMLSFSVSHHERFPILPFIFSVKV